MTESRVFFAKGTGFDTIAGSPTYYRPGYDIRVEELSFDNNLLRLRQEDSAAPIESIEGRFRGTLGLSWAMSNTTHDDVRDIVFNSGGTSFTTGQPAFSRWFIGSNYFDTGLSSNTVELELRSCIPLGYQLTYEAETNTVRENLRLGFADLRKNTSFTTSTITGPAADSTAPFHGTALTINNSTVNRNQNAVLDFPEPLSRYRFEDDRFAVNAVAAGVEPTLRSAVLYHQDDFLGLGLSGDTTTSTQPQSELGDVANSSIAFSTSGGTTIATYSFSKLTLTDWSAENIVSRDQDADFEGVANWAVDGGVSIS